jgi:uncharacterized membrane protein YuzA (DUF378 family)
MSLTPERECLLLCYDPATNKLTEHGNVVSAGSPLLCNTAEAVLFYILLGVVLVGALNWLSAAFMRRDLVLSFVGGKAKSARYVYGLVGVCGVALIAMLVWIGLDKNRRCAREIGLVEEESV